MTDDRCVMCRRLTGDGADREPYVVVTWEHELASMCERCFSRGSVDVPVSYEEDDGA